LSEEQCIVAKQDNACHPGMDTFGNCVHHHPKVCQFPHVRSNGHRRLPVQSTAAHIDGYLYSLLQHRCRWLLVQSAAAQKLFLPYRMKPSEYLYLRLQFNLQLTHIFCKFLILMLLNLLRRICCCFLVTSCPFVCFTKPALVISSSMYFVHNIKREINTVHNILPCTVFHLST
jgi:hypothetical protein